MKIARLVTIISRIDVDVETKKVGASSEIIPSGEITERQAEELNKAVNASIYEWLQGPSNKEPERKSAKIWTPHVVNGGKA
jgi:hypothetical protein